jgi:hypothetical protein
MCACSSVPSIQKYDLAQLFEPIGSRQTKRTDFARVKWQVRALFGHERSQ